jgi:hypothetical protein
MICRDQSGNMLIAYLPKEKIVVNADLYTPPAQGAAPPANVSPNGVALFQNIKRLKLDVAQHVPIHGSPGESAEGASPLLFENSQRFSVLRSVLIVERTIHLQHRRNRHGTVGRGAAAHRWSRASILIETQCDGHFRL